MIFWRKAPKKCGISVKSIIVMARLVRAIHFPEAIHFLRHLWKMDGRHKGGHDVCLKIPATAIQMI
jgi:hypothetical protein